MEKEPVKVPRLTAEQQQIEARRLEQCQREFQAMGLLASVVAVGGALVLLVGAGVWLWHVFVR